MATTKTKAKTKSSKASTKASKMSVEDLLATPIDEISTKLADLFKSQSLVEKDLILPSGQIGHFYVDTKQTLLGSEGGTLASIGILQMLKPEVSSLGGISSNATSVASGAIQLAYLQGIKLNSFFVRKEPRKFGKSPWVEGPLEPNEKVCIIEDVLLDGANVINAIRRIQEEFGAEVVQVIAVLDRKEGGLDRLEELGIDVTTICSIEDIIDVDS